MKTAVSSSYWTSISQSNFCKGDIAIESYTKITTVIDVHGHCPFPIEGTDIEGFDFWMTVKAAWIEGHMDDILYSPITGEEIQLRYMMPGYNIMEEGSLEAHLVEDEWITQQELYRRAKDFTAFKLCDLLDEEDAVQKVWNNLLARDYTERVVTLRYPDDR